MDSPAANAMSTKALMNVFGLFIIFKLSVIWKIQERVEGWGKPISGLGEFEVQAKTGESPRFVVCEKSVSRKEEDETGVRITTTKKFFVVSQERRYIITPRAGSTFCRQAG